jgi:hypothetical protein
MATHEVQDTKDIHRNETGQKFYEKPQLQLIGDVRSLTLGGSAGMTESSGLRRNTTPGGGLRRP